jgi:hypothetical protein
MDREAQKNEITHGCIILEFTAGRLTGMSHSLP